ncbi:MAG: MBL fold metallo-hydrolase [Candidatus Abyssobacteria bacterium SURF_5]|uniref:MBL fold metallo-hydrolase n=1 Tax=Abyssobacteria bacterium (strain SURF_5) TaxID=2093360 RepID=A0A3A4NLZ7_ABYX5|nr:MAG: MBL fold metallo-hydrolase [Candidatus Abyssubacteria bacterium SURF_5]
MENYICVTCGAQYKESKRPPENCIICEDERQYLNAEGQQWTTLSEMKTQGYRNEFRELEPGLVGIHTQPDFAIGQVAYLVRTEAGNVLWDCISYIDEETVERIEKMGGVKGIAVSHPHFYSSIVEWSHGLGRPPVYIPLADKKWVVRPDPVIQYWDDAKEILPGVTIIQCGGHFDGSSVLHWRHGAAGKGVLLVGDTMGVAKDARYVSFMYSYPNLIPLPPPAIRGIMEALRPYEFDRIYSAWWGKMIPKGAKEAVEKSGERYIRHVQAA